MALVLRALRCRPGLDVRFFNAATHNDVGYLSRHARRVRQYDTRESDPARQIHNGLAAVHYAILGNANDAFTALYRSEGTLVTRAELSLQLPAYGLRTAYCPPGLDSMHLALLLQRDSMVHYMLAQDFRLCQSHFAVLAMQPLTDSVRSILLSNTNAVVMTHQNDYCDNDFAVPRTYVHSVIYHRRMDHLTLLITELAHQCDQQLYQAFFHQLVHVFAGGKCLVSVLRLRLAHKPTGADEHVGGLMIQCLKRLQDVALGYFSGQRLDAATSVYLVTQGLCIDAYDAVSLEEVGNRLIDAVDVIRSTSLAQPADDTAAVTI